MIETELKPFFNVGAGDIISDFLESLGWTQKDLSEISGFSKKTINLIVNNKQSITTETAIILGKIFNTKPELWLNLDAAYRIRKNEECGCVKTELKEQKALLRTYMPVSEMKKKKWFLYDIDTIDGIKKECERVFGQDHLPKELYSEDYVFCARQTDFDYEYTKWYSQTWYLYAKLFSEKITLPKYDKTKFKEIANNLSNYTKKKDGIEQFIADINECGVGFFSLSHLTKTYLDGATFIANNNPFIVYTGRYNREDNFWFVIAHEISHIILHFDFLSKPILDNLDSDTQNSRELEADSMARVFLKNASVLEYVKKEHKINEKNLFVISNQTNLSLSVIVGILQHNKIIEWNRFKQYQPKIMDKIPNYLILG